MAVGLIFHSTGGALRVVSGIADHLPDLPFGVVHLALGFPLVIAGDLALDFYAFPAT